MNDLYRPVARRLVLLSLVVFIGLTGHKSYAQQGTSIAGQPVIAVVFFAGYDALSNDLELIGKLAEKPGLKDIFEGFANMATGGSGLEGLDHTEPWGAVLYGNDFKFMAFIPATDPAVVMAGLRSIAQGKLREAQNGVYHWEQSGRTFFVTAKDNFVWFASDPQQFDSLPAGNPREALGDLPTEYDFAVRLHVKAIPRTIRQLFVNGFEAGFRRAVTEMFPTDDPERQSQNDPFAKWVRTLEDLNTVTVGWKFDEAQAEANLDVVYTAVEGTALSRAARRLQSSPSRFAGFVSPQAAISTNVTLSLDSQQSRLLIACLNQARKGAISSVGNDGTHETEKQRELAIRSLRSLFDEVAATVRRESVDFAGSVIAKPAIPADVSDDQSFALNFDQLTFLAAAEVDDAARVEQLIRKRIELESDTVTVHWNAFTHDGVRLHRLLLPADEHQRPTFGDSVDAVVGFGPHSCYFAMGHNAEQSLVSAIDGSKAQAGSQLAPVRFSVSITDCFLCSPPSEPFQQLHVLWRKISENDKLHVTFLPVEHGGKLQVRLERGVIQGLCKTIGIGIDQNLPGRRGG